MFSSRNTFIIIIPLLILLVIGMFISGEKRGRKCPDKEVNIQIVDSPDSAVLNFLVEDDDNEDDFTRAANKVSMNLLPTINPSFAPSTPPTQYQLIRSTSFKHPPRY